MERRRRCASLLTEVDEAAFDRPIDVNVKGAFFTMQTAPPRLNDGASIVINGSINALIAMAGMSITRRPRQPFPHARFGNADEVAEAVLFLASDDGPPRQPPSDSASSDPPSPTGTRRRASATIASPAWA